jgi:hypothetical protein
MPDFYWCPLIALFTGARAEETQADVEQYAVKGTGLLTFKGQNANANVSPAHQAIDLGLVDYRMSLARAGYKSSSSHSTRHQWLP